MKLKTAIEVLERPVSKTIPSGEIAHLDATRLGIEALKQLKQIRAYAKDLFLPLLPGETPEEET